jgi:hypothetical protein
MIKSTPRKSSLAAVAVAGLFTLFLTMTPQMTAAEVTKLTSKEVKTLVATAKTPADHMKLAKYYEGEAAKLEAESKMHEELAQIYRKNPNAMGMKTPMNPTSAEHCEYFAKATREAAKAAKDLAAAHEQMAKAATK